MLHIAFGLYLANLLVGAAAQFTRRHLGLAHHILYFIVFTTAVLAALVSFHPALLLTLLMLALMPKSKPGHWTHPAAALLGVTGYLIVFIF